MSQKCKAVVGGGSGISGTTIAVITMVVVYVIEKIGVVIVGKNYTFRHGL